MHGDNFHFYNECFDDDAVYLELEGVEFQAGYRRVMVTIPIDIWKTIRHLGAAKFDLADKTDEDLRETVTKVVDTRIRECEKEHEETNGFKPDARKPALRFSGRTTR